MQEALFISDQVRSLAVTVILGLVAGIFYDIFRVMRKMLRPPRWLLFFFDLAFWFLLTALAFVALLATSSGDVRAHVLVGIGLGGLLYALLFSRAVFRLMDFLGQKVLAIINLVLAPPLWLGRGIASQSRRIGLAMTGAAGRGWRVIRQKIRTIIKKKRRN